MSSSTSSSSSGIPIIDVSPFFQCESTAAERQSVVDQVRDACVNVGFLVITGHGVGMNVIEDAWKSAKEFFDLPVAEKQEVAMNEEYIYGYTGLGDEVLLRSSDSSYGIADLKETFQICLGPEQNPDPTMVAPRWPSKPATLKPALTAYYRSLERVAAGMLRIFALALKLPENYFDDKIDHHMSALRCLNYPHQDRDPLPGQFRASAHTDYGSMTILRQDDAPGGLQVLYKGEWVDVKTPPDAYIINLGDLMQRWTNDQWVSTLHRVVNPPRDATGSTRRQSIAFFHNMNKDLLIDCIPTCMSADAPAKYPPITAGEHLKLKHNAAMGYGNNNTNNNMNVNNKEVAAE